MAGTDGRMNFHGFGIFLDSVCVRDYGRSRNMTWSRVTASLGKTSFSVGKLIGAEQCLSGSVRLMRI
jgi:hypothetical protein